MERNVFICIILCVCLIIAAASSSSKKSHEKAKENPSQLTTSVISDSNSTSKPAVGANGTSQSLNETISMRSSRKRLKERRYVPSYPSQYSPAVANDYCPPLADSCPSCISYSSQLPEDICSYSVVMKVLMLSPPSTDVYGRVCGKLGLLSGLANTDIKQYRRLLRLSVPEACGCILNASSQYILISRPTAFLKDGSLNSKISLSSDVIMLPVDRYTEAVTLKPLEQCYLKPQPDSYAPQSSEYIEQHIQPRSYRKKITPPPTPYPSDLYATPQPAYPEPNPYPYYQPPDVQPYVPPPSTFYVPPYSPMSYPLAGPITYKVPSFVPQFTNCIQEESCPKCLQPGEVNLEQEYCTSDFAYIALVTLPGLTKVKGDYSDPYDANSCLNIRATVLHEVSKSSDAKLMNIQLNLLLPKQCGCFSQLKGFAIVLLLGHYTNSPIYQASPQLRKELTLVYLPAPSEISVPNCVSYPVPTPYVPPIQNLQEYPIPNCPYGFEASCPACSALADQIFLDQFCAAKFALVAELQGSGSYAVLTPKIPSVQITTSEDEYNYKSILIKVIKSSPPSCIEGSLGILQVIKPPQDYYTLPSIVPFTVLSECLLECPLLTVPGTKLLLYSSKDTMILSNGVIQLAGGVYVAPLGIYDTLPSCPEQYFPEPDPAPYVTTSLPAKFPDFPTVYSVVASMVVNPETPSNNIYGAEYPPIYSKEYSYSYTEAPPPPYVAPALQPYTPPPISYKTDPPPYSNIGLPSYNSAPPSYATVAPLQYKTDPPPYVTAAPPLYKTEPPPYVPASPLPSYETKSLPYVTAAPPPSYETKPPPYVTAAPPPSYETKPPPYTTAAPPSYKTDPPPYVSAAPPLSYKTDPPPYVTAAPPISYKTDPPPYATAAPPPYVAPSKEPSYTTPQKLYKTVPPLPYKTTAKPPYKPPPPSSYTPAPEPSYKAVPKAPKQYTTAAPPPYTPVPSPPPVIPSKTLVPQSSPYAIPEYKPCLVNDFSCPECSHSLPANFKEAYCMANTAIIIASGLNYNTYKEYEDPMQLAFNPPGPYHINIQPGVYNPGLDVTVSPFRPFDVVSKQNAAANQLCFKDTIRALYDVTKGYESPKKLSLDIDVYFPALCPDCPIFLQSPAYGIILSKNPLYLNGPIQLTNQFSYFPLPKAVFSLPDCYSESYSSDSVYSVASVDKYQVPAYPIGKQLSCDYPPVCQKCPDPPLFPYFEIPCDQKLALVVEVLETSTGKPGAPTLEVTVYQKHIEYYVTYVVALNIQDSPPAPDTSGPYKNANSCKYAKVKVIQDLSPYPVVPPGTILTVLGAPDCDCSIFSISQGFNILLAPEYSGTTITIGPATAITLPFGYSSISLCSPALYPEPVPPTYAPPVPPAYAPPVQPTFAPPVQPTYAPPAKPNYPPPVPPTYALPVPPTYPPPVPPTYPPHVPPIYPPPVPPTYPPPVPPTYPPKVPPIAAPPPAISTNPPYVPPVEPVTKSPLPPPAQVDVNYGLQFAPAPPLPCNENDGCTICGNSAALNENPDVYCDSLIVFLVRISKVEKDKDDKCASGAAISMYEITASKPAQKAVLNIFFTLPHKCVCPQLAIDKFALLMIHKSIPITNPLVLNLDSSFNLYSVPKGRLTLPYCAISQFVPRTRDLDEIFVDPVDNELTLLRRKELDLEKCPTTERTCPKCDYMDSEDLKNLICSSDFAFEVTINPKPDQRLRRHERPERISVSQYPAKNFSIDIVVKPYEGPDTCNSPVREGNCNSELEKFYYDIDDHECKKFSYSGCNGNANNFNSYKECEESCMTEGFCDEGNLYVQSNPRNKFSENWSKRELQYYVGEDCDCPSLIPDPYCKYLIYNSTAFEHKHEVHLSKNFYFIPLTERQRAAPITCDVTELTDISSIETDDATMQESHLDYHDKIYDKYNTVTDSETDLKKDSEEITNNDTDAPEYDGRSNLEGTDAENDTDAFSNLDVEQTITTKDNSDEVKNIENEDHLTTVDNLTNNDDLSEEEDSAETTRRSWFGK